MVVPCDLGYVWRREKENVKEQGWPRGAGIIYEKMEEDKDSWRKDIRKEINVKGRNERRRKGNTGNEGGRREKGRMGGK